MTTQKNPQQGINRVVLFLFLLVFLGPLLFAWKVYKQEDYLKFGTTHNGTLISPAPSIKGIALFDNQGTPISREAFLGRWWLVNVVQTPCDEACETYNQLLDNVGIALGKNQSRVGRLVLSTEPSFQFHRPHERKLAQVTSKELSNSLEPYKIYSDNSPQIYIIDPMGQIILAYPADANFKAIHKDLKRLLTVSHVG